ncbi:Uncharacterised protein [Legionella jordanis]|nr:Uncharacterised protein [Legionella jordanis]
MRMKANKSKDKYIDYNLKVIFFEDSSHEKS